MKTESFKVAGISFRERELKKLASENDDFKMSKREMIDEDMTDERVYKFTFDVSKVELIPEPDNPEDGNAIKVVTDGELIGYIKKGSTGRVRTILKEGKIKSIEVEIGGGPYKYLFENDDDKYELEKDVAPFFAEVKITHGDQDREESKPEPVKEAPKNEKKKGMFGKLFGR